MMATLLPIVKDILPIIMPKPVSVIRAEAVESATTGGHTPGMTRKGAIIGLSDKMCGLVMHADPHSHSAIHHHGDQDTIVYCASGVGAVRCQKDPGNPGSEIVMHQLHPGDWALIPAWAEHQEVNQGEEKLVWIITRSGGTPETINLEGWGGKAQA